ncbi:MAG: FtsX-like permease family protein [Candidatus Bathyarchaeia archaeon]
MAFPLKDLARRKLHSTLTVVGLAVCVCVVVSLFLISENLSVKITGFSETGLTFGFSAVFSRFIILVVVLSGVTGVFVVYFLMFTAVSDRTRDVGIMKAVGCPSEAIFQHFATEFFVLVLTGCLVGTFLGIALHFLSVSLLNGFGFRISVCPLNWQMILLIFTSFAVFSFVLCLRLTGRLARIKPVGALSNVSGDSSRQRSNLRALPIFGRSLTARIALRSLGRRWPMTVRVIACLDVVMVLVTIIVVGGLVAEETMLSYVQRAVGSDVVLIAKPEVAEYYERLLNKFLQSDDTEFLGFLNEDYAIPSFVVSEIMGIQGVAKVDPRLVLEARVEEVQHISPNPNNPGQYVVVGDKRGTDAVLLGVQIESLVSDWLVFGEKLQNGGGRDVMLGDTLAASCFEDPLVQSLKVFGSEFRVVGVCWDTLNNGVVVYMPYEKLCSLVNCSGFNVVLVQVKPLSRSETLRKVEDAVSSSGLVVVDLSLSLDRQLSFVGQVWSLLLSLSLLSFASAVTSLVGFLMLSVSGQQRDFGVMRALGAKPKTIHGTVLFQTFLLVSAGAVFGFPVGLAIVLFFLIPEPVVSLNAVVAVALLTLGLIAALCLASLYPARKASMAQILTLWA